MRQNRDHGANMHPMLLTFLAMFSVAGLMRILFLYDESMRSPEYSTASCPIPVASLYHNGEPNLEYSYLSSCRAIKSEPTPEGMCNFTAICAPDDIMHEGRSMSKEDCTYVPLIANQRTMPQFTLYRDFKTSRLGKIVTSYSDRIKDSKDTMLADPDCKLRKQLGFSVKH